MDLPPAVTSLIDGAIEFVYSFGPMFECTVVLGKLFLLNDEEGLGFSSSMVTWPL